jgi:hypothetical protein
MNALSIETVSIDDRMINEHGAVGGMRIGMDSCA